MLTLNESNPFRRDVVSRAMIAPQPAFDVSVSTGAVMLQRLFSILRPAYSELHQEEAQRLTGRTSLVEEKWLGAAAGYLQDLTCCQRMRKSLTLNRPRLTCSRRTTSTDRGCQGWPSL